MKKRLVTMLLFLLMCVSIIPMATIEAEASVGDKCKYCGHSPFLADPYDKYGNCEKCGKAYDYQSSKKSESGLFMTATEISPKLTPYGEGTKVNVTIPKGELVTVVASYINAKAHVWYEVEYKGKKGFIYDGNMTKVADAGNIYSLSGYITVHHGNNIWLYSAPSTSSNKIKSFGTACEFTVSKLVKAKDGAWWYYCTDIIYGETGWMPCIVGTTGMNIKFSYNGARETSSIIKGTPVPSSISNTKRDLEGSIQTSGQKIYRVSVAIYNGTSTSGTSVMGGKWYTVNATSYNLKGSDASKALAFENLTPGKQYTLKISVEIVACKCFQDSAAKDYIYTVDKTYTFTVSCTHSYDSSYTTDGSNHWKVCTICGAVGTKSGHSFTTEYNTSQHWQKCSTCGYTKSKTSHSLIQKSDSNYHWQGCSSCGYTTSKTSHSMSSSYDYDGSGHWKKCTSCGYAGTKTSHTLTTERNDSQHWQKCSCGYTTSKTSHSLTQNYDSNGHWKECSCGYKTSTTSHSLTQKSDSNYHWQGCSSCGYTKSKTSHSMSSSYDYDSNGHWKKCTSCGYAGTKTSHTLTTERNDSQHWQKCSCGYTTSATNHSLTQKSDSNYHWQGCSSCGYTTSKTSHSMSSSYDYDGSGHWKKCTSCGYAGTKTSHTLTTERNDSQHWQKCSCGYTTSKTSHSLTQNYDSNGHWKECSCGYKTSTTSHSLTQKSDSNYHWHECSCGLSTAKAAHTAGFAPTCTTAQICTECGKELIGALGHDYHTEWQVDVPPTCTTVGSKSHHCNRCDDKTDITEIPAKEHTWSNWSVTQTPTCSVAGIDERECSVCHTKETRTTNVIDHTNTAPVVENKVDATCIADGSYDSIIYCSVCKREISRTSHVIEKLGHDYSIEWTIDVTPNCTTVGSKSHHCTRCDDKTDITEIPTGDHINAAPVVENKVDATCTVDGSYDSVIYCSVCSIELNREKKTLEAPGHDYETIWGSNETSHWKECGCGDKSAFASHSWNDGKVTQEATTETEGIMTYTCTVCSRTKTESIAKLSNHPDIPKSPETPPVSQKKNNREGLSNEATIAIVASSVVAGGVGGFSLFWFVIKRKSFF